MKKFYTYLSSEERNLKIESLVSKKNHLISAGKYTDGAQDVLLKIIRAKKKKSASDLLLKRRERHVLQKKHPLVVPFHIAFMKNLYYLSEQCICIL